MRFFASSHQISQLAPRTRILCALFLIGILFQGVSGVLMHHHGAGWTPDSIATYYRGSDAPIPVNNAAFGLDAVDAAETPDLPPPPKQNIAIARSFGTLLEVAHLHLVAMPLVLFVVAHLFSMTPSGRTRLAGAICYGSFIAAAADILSPFAIRYLSAGFAYIKLPAFLLLEGTLIFMVLATLLSAIASFRTPPVSAGSGPFTRAD